jgi:hypothetical protein
VAIVLASAIGSRCATREMQVVDRDHVGPFGGQSHG